MKNAPARPGARLTLPAPMVRIASPGRAAAQQFLDSLLHGAVEDDVLVPCGANGFRQRLPGNAGDGLLARGVDVHQHDHVGLIEGAAKFIPKMLACACSGAAGRAPGRARNGSRARLRASRESRRVMAVIVDQRDVVDDALDVKPPPHAGKFFDARRESVPAGTFKYSATAAAAAALRTL